MVENPLRQVQWLPTFGLECAILLEREENYQQKLESKQTGFSINSHTENLNVQCNLRRVCLHNPDVVILSNMGNSSCVNHSQ